MIQNRVTSEVCSGADKFGLGKLSSGKSVDGFMQRR